MAHGPPASGKTRFAATVSEQFPEKTGEKWVDLTDIVWLSIDQGALDGLSVEKLNIPFVPVRELMAAAGAVQGSMDALLLLESILSERPDVKFVVVDTLSELSERWMEVFTRASGDDTRSAYRQLGDTHTRWKARLDSICDARGVRVIFLAHSKARVLDDKATEGQKKAAQAERVGNDEIGLDIDGNGRHLYTRNASLVFAVKCKTSPKGENKYSVHCRGGDGFLTKDRLARLLNPEEPPDMRAIFKKITAAMNKGE